MEYRLGLDLGTASIGAVALTLTDPHKPIEILTQRLRLFSEPVEPNAQGVLQTKKAAYRMARQQRTQINRRAKRLRKIAKLAEHWGLDHKTIAPDNGQHLPRLRALAVTEQVTLEDLFRIFLKLAKRRGYAGGFRTQSDESGEVKSGVERLRNIMRERGCDTLGQYLYDRHQRGLPIHLKIKTTGGNTGKKNGKQEIPNPETENLYATRELVVEEFNALWDKQATFHPVMNSEYNGKPLKTVFRETIFHQLPLKSVSGMVGKCPLVLCNAGKPHLPRTPRSHPAAQAFRIEKQLCDLRWGIGKNAKTLSSKQISVIRALLTTQGKTSFSSIEKALEKAGCPKPVGKSLNLQNVARDELQGNSTLAAFRSLGLEQAWVNTPANAQTQIINLLADMGSPEQFDAKDWHTQMIGANGKPRSFAPETISFINALVASGKFGRMAKMKLEGGRSAYSIKALQRLTEWLQNQYQSENWVDTTTLSEDSAIRACYPHVHQKRALQDALPSPPKTGNDVVDGALRQLYHTLISIRDELQALPSRIVVEMSRELGQGVTRRNEMLLQQETNKKARDKAKQALEKENCVVNERNIKRYLLAEEQDHRCPYCQGQNHLGIEKLTHGGETNFEHILPRSLTRAGLKRSEIVLAHSACNHAKGDQTPWQAWGDGRDPERWKAVEIMADILNANADKMYRKDKTRATAMRRKAKLLLLRDFENEVLNDESIANFVDRQFHESSWIAKAAAQWLRTICPDVAVSRGQMTALLRRGWGLETVIPEVRLLEGFPVLDDENKPISAEEFTDCRPAWEGHAKSHSGQYVERQLNKRIDHRHHLIDALTIALTDRSLYKQMADRYRDECERNQRRGKHRTRLSAAPLLDVRNAALRMISTCEVSHKPDRYPTGQLFDANPLGVVTVENKAFFVHRKALTELALNKGKEKSNTDTLTAIKNIVSDEVRHLVETAFMERVASGMTALQALQEPILNPHYSRPNAPVYIKKVRCFATGGKNAKLSAESAKKITHQNRQSARKGKVLTKYLNPEGYAYLELVVKNGKVIGIPNLVPLHIATTQTKNSTIEGAMRFYKQDTVEHIVTGKCYVVRQIKGQSNGLLVLTPVTESRPVKKLSAGDGLYTPSGQSLAKLRVVKECQNTVLS